MIEPTQGSQYPFSNLESEHFSATSGGLYSLVGSGDANGGGGASTVHDMGVADCHVDNFHIECTRHTAVICMKSVQVGDGALHGDMLR